MRRTGTARRWAPSLVLALAVLLTTANFAAATPGSKLWLTTYDGPNALGDSANAIAVAPDGSTIFVTGMSSTTSTDTDIATVAYDAETHQQLWAMRWDGQGARDNGLAIAVAPDNSAVFVAGLSQGSGGVSRAVETLAYAASDGSELWSRRFRGPDINSTTPAALAVDPDGSTVFVTGATPGGSSRSDFRTVAYAASTGVVSWTKRFDDGVNDMPMAVAVDPAGATVFVTGRGARRFVTLAYDATTGERAWLNRYTVVPGEQHLAWSIGVAPDGGSVYVGGLANNAHNEYDMVTFALDASTGRRSWADRFDGKQGDDEVRDLAVSPDGRTVAITGGSQDVLANSWITTIAYRASDGVTRWKRLVTDRDKNGLGNALAFANKGELIVTGSGGGANTMSFDASNGTRIWLRQLKDRGLSDLVIAPDHSAAYLTGQSPAGVAPDFVTVAYSLV